MSETAIVMIEKDVLGELSELSHDQVLAVWDKAQFFARETKRIKDLVEAEVLRWVQAHGELNCGNGVRYYAGIDKTTKCQNVPAAVEALMTACEGDFTRFCDTLASNAIKHSAAKKILAPEVYDGLFKVIEKDVLEEGKIAKKLMRADDNFTGKK
jgi:hypothetical protein